MYITFSTALSLFRLSFSFIFSLMLYYLLPLNYQVVSKAMAVLFFFTSMTDYFDGYLARKWKQETELGRVLDPLADKVFVTAPLVVFVAINKMYFYWAVVLITRELLVSALRESAMECGITLPVSWWGKWKSTFQYSYIFLAIGAPWPWASFLLLERFVLGGSLILSTLSAGKYTAAFVKTLSQRSSIKDRNCEI